MAIDDRDMVARFLRGESEAVGTVDGWISRAAWPYQRRLADRWDDVLQDIRLEVTRLLDAGEVPRRVEPADLPLAGGEPHLPRSDPRPEQVEVDRPGHSGPGGRAGHAAGAMLLPPARTGTCSCGCSTGCPRTARRCGG